MFRRHRVPFEPRDVKWGASATSHPRMTAPTVPARPPPSWPVSPRVPRTASAAPHASGRLPLRLLLSISAFRALLPRSGAARQLPAGHSPPLSSPLWPAAGAGDDVTPERHVPPQAGCAPGAGDAAGPPRRVITKANTDHPPITDEQI